MQRSGRAGLGLALLAGATFGTSGTFADSLIKAGWSPAGVVLARISLGALILTGPAGSGKTTTIYALLQQIAAMSPYRIV